MNNDELMRIAREQAHLTLSEMEKRILTCMELGHAVDIYPHFLEPGKVFFVDEPITFPQSNGNTVLLVHDSLTEELAATLRKLDITVRVSPR